MLGGTIRDINGAILSNLGGNQSLGKGRFVDLMINIQAQNITWIHFNDTFTSVKRQ